MQSMIRLDIQDDRLSITVTVQDSVRLALRFDTQAQSVAQTEKETRLRFADAELHIQLLDDRLSFIWQGLATAQIEMQDYWYGGGQLINQHWPLNKVMLPLREYVTCDNGETGLSTLLTPIWFNHQGTVLAVKSPFAIGMNQPPEKYLARHAKINPDFIPFDERPWEDRDGVGDCKITLQGQDLVFEVLFAADFVTACQMILAMAGKPQATPPLDLLTDPTWTTWARYKNRINQDVVLEFAQEIVANQYPFHILEIDDRWQAQYGDLAFDTELFPDPKQMIAELHKLGFKVTLWVIPFLHPKSEIGRVAAERGYVVQTPMGEPYLVKWWQGRAYLIDTTNVNGMAWFAEELKAFQTEYDLDGFKFDGGEAKYVPADAVLDRPVAWHNEYTHAYIQWVAETFSTCEARSGWYNQTAPIFFRIWDLWSAWGHDNGLRSIIPSVLTMSVTGYPYVLPDMIGGNAYFEFPKNKLINWLTRDVIAPLLERKLKRQSENPEDEVLGLADVPLWLERSPYFGYATAELMIRWTQLNSLLQVMQFSLAPWEFGEECNRICHRYAQLHLEFAPMLKELTANVVKTGLPVIRPLAWLAPNDERALLCDDQFLVGERVVVAPVLHKGQRSRDVYLPPGNWQDYWLQEVFVGPTVLKNYPAPLEKLPLFLRQD